MGQLVLLTADKLNKKRQDGDKKDKKDGFNIERGGGEKGDKKENKKTFEVWFLEI